MGTKELGDNSGFLATWYKLQVQNDLSKLRCIGGGGGGGVWAEIIFPHCRSYERVLSHFSGMQWRFWEGVGVR